MNTQQGYTSHSQSTQSGYVGHSQNIPSVFGPSQASQSENIGPSSVRANWTNPEWHKLFVVLCLDQVQRGNRPTTCLNKQGWKTLCDEFCAKTGLRYTKAQMKNHWDTTKDNWKEWNRLISLSGGGFDAITRTLTQNQNFWDEQIRVRGPIAAQFRWGPLQFEKELDIIFGGTNATGNYQFVPNSGVVPNQQTQESASPSVRNILQDSSDDDVVSRADAAAPKRSKRKKISGAVRLGTQLEKLVDCVQARSKSSSVPTESFSIKDCVSLLNATDGLIVRSDLYMDALNIIQKNQTNREMFVAIPAQVRLAWLKRQIKP